MNERSVCMKTQWNKQIATWLSQMTLEEKCSLTVYRSPAIERLGIPAYNWWNEALHGVARAGVATVFPQAIGLAATFDEELLEEVASIIALEGRGKYHAQVAEGDRDIYKGLTFWSPNVNIFRDPRWGRGHETFGEDPFLSGRCGVRFIKGLQGDDPDYLKTAACAKHFAVHSGPEDLRHSFDAVVSPQDLQETYLPAFLACVQEGNVEAIMGAYNCVNGEPCCGSKTLLADLLRESWGFAGHVVSDCWAIKDFHEYHHVTHTALESVKLAMDSGCDLNCGVMYLYLEAAYREGLITEQQMDQSVARLLATRMKLGILDPADPGPYAEIPYDVVDCREHQQTNVRVAEQTLVLLKNEQDCLPLDLHKIKRIGVIGPNANSRTALEGNYQGTASRYVTILEGIQDHVPEDVIVRYAEGCHLYRDRMTGLALEGINDRLSEALIVAKQSDVVILVMGLDALLEGEEGDQGNEFDSGDRKNLSLPGLQHQLIQEIHQLGKPTVLILLSGSAVAMPWEAEHLDAILQAWYPGAMGGKAVANVLFGDRAPEGKLPITFYCTTEELPDFVDYSMQGRTYRYITQEALYPFGYGLSYTIFSLSDVALTPHPMTPGDYQVTATLHNLGNYDGAETVQVYLRPPHGNGLRHQLKALQKVRLCKGSSCDVVLSLPRKAFEVADEQGIKQIQAGEYQVLIGLSQPDARSQALTGQQPTVIPITLR